MTQRSPHIILFNPDQWRGDVLGHRANPAAHTPTLDTWMRSDAVSFANAFCQNPVCTPSRCSFMTGWYPHVRGHRTMFHMLRPDEPMLLKVLKDHGYHVWWGGKNDVVPAQHGFEAYCDVKYQAPDQPSRPLQANLHQIDDWRGSPEGDNYYSFYGGQLEIPADDEVYFDSDWAMIEGALEHIHNAPEDVPLCIYLPLSYPHPPYAVEEPWYSMIDREAIPARIPSPPDWRGKPKLLRGIAEHQRLQGWTEDRWTELRATYYGMCARVDHQFSLVLNALKAKGLYDDAAIFFFSDHGDFTGDYGLVEKTQNTFEDVLTRVPLLIKPPAAVTCQAGLSDALVELIDVPATIYALTGIEPGYDHFGRSLLPLLAGEQREHRDAVFCEGGRRRFEDQAKELESRQTPQGLYWPRVHQQVADHEAHSKAVMCRSKDYKYVMRLYEPDELYDLRADPQELHNCSEDPAYLEVKQQHKDRLLRFYLETADVVPWETDRRT